MKARLGLATVLTLLVAVPAAVAQQSGYYVLDGFGGVHAGGGAPEVSPQTPYFGFDVAEDLVYVPPGRFGRDGVLVLDAFGGVHVGGAIAVDSLTLRTPYFGFDVARGIASRTPGLGSLEKVHGTCTTISPSAAAHLQANCAGPQKLTGGGVVYYSSNTCTTPLILAASDRILTFSGPVFEGWRAGVFNDSSSAIYTRATAICVGAP